jgi:chemotaxis protein methyltransferase CheR
MSVLTGADIRLTEGEFKEFSRFIYDTFGISLSDNKRDMLTQRLRSLVVELGFTSFDDFFKSQLRNPSPEILSDVIDRVSTNHTYFNREPAHFDFLTRTVMPELAPRIRKRSKGTPDFRLWCAAASRGHEPYTLAMLVRDYLGAEYSRWHAGLLATDISENALSVARSGVYPETEVAALPAGLRERYFKSKGEGFQEVVSQIRKDVTFRRLNLMNAAYPFRQGFDVVFCRNVLIYFDPPTKKAVCSKIGDVMQPGGYLFVGLAETLGRESAPFEYVQPGVYVRGGT